MNVANSWAFWIGLIGALAVLCSTFCVACGAGCRVHDAAQGRLLSAAGRRLYRQRANRRQDIPGGGSVFTITTSPLAPIPLCRRSAAAESTSPTAC
jgi:hypothetical protein